MTEINAITATTLPDHHVESDHDEAAVEAARRFHSPTIGAGFEVWHEERLVHREREFPRS